MKYNIDFFNFSRANHLSLSTIVDDNDYDLIVGRWISGRIFGRYVSIFIPWKGRRDGARRSHP
jgi:hypothetical protein